MSQLAQCGCWDCKNRITLLMGTMVEHREEAGPRRMIVQATWTAEARSRTGSRTRLPAAPRETRSPRSRTTSPAGHRRVEKDESTTPINEARGRARDKILVETKTPVRKETRMMERTKAALVKEIR